tara:strand:- start:802 stop:912 length:111 start_codon:yes stop_codon:yes gene_type:complete
LDFDLVKDKVEKPELSHGTVLAFFFLNENSNALVAF